ncbi:hypothetical protein Bca52824_082341 [Brassica carinata]|uniref:At2g35280-like TPR domain-containing protein n=1 Tax=Brassica carinata TaxID=52824 RepID=A0A8X7PJ51_BRACI|nr:hypothetical protein Bca52824_082341 [Brassica carinata]
MDQCLASGNIQAHYVRGIHEYFRNDNAIDGMYHLRLSAYVYYVYGVYLSDIIMLCRGEQAVGRAYLDMLGWREQIKISLHGIAVARLPVYTTTYHEIRAAITCLRNNIGRRCELCFYFRQMQKFVYMI